MNILKKKNSLKVFKHEKLNKAVFTKYNFNDYRVQLLLILKIKKISTNKAIIPPSDIKKEHSVNIKEFKEIFNVDQSACYRIFRRAAHVFVNSKILLQNLDSDYFKIINLCSSAEYIGREGKLNIKFTDDIIPYLSQGTQRYVLYSLDQIKMFRSLYTLRFFELLQGYKYCGYLEITIDELRKIFNVRDKLKKYSHFKARTFQKSIQEIKKINSDFNISIEEIFLGRKVQKLKIQFSFGKVDVRSIKFSTPLFPQEIPSIESE